MSSVKKYIKGSILRWLLTVVLLYFVWFGPRWVMALAVTMLTIANEMTSFGLHAIFKWRREISR